MIAPSPLASPVSIQKTHFSGRFEAELKYKADDLDKVRAALKKLNAEPFLLGNFEHDIYFDSPDRHLKRQDQALVLRHMRPSGRILWIVKGPGRDLCSATELGEFDKPRKMLAALGYDEVFQIEKHRDVFFVGPMHVTLDRIADLGNFVEVAIMTDDEAALPALKDDLAALAAKLGLEPPARITKSYREILDPDF